MERHNTEPKNENIVVKKVLKIIKKLVEILYQICFQLILKQKLLFSGSRDCSGGVKTDKYC